VLQRAARSVLLAVSLLTAGAPEGTAAGRPEVPAQLPPAARARIQPRDRAPSLAVKVDGQRSSRAARSSSSCSIIPIRHARDPRAEAGPLQDLAHAERARIDDGWGTVGTFETVWAGTGLR